MFDYVDYFVSMCKSSYRYIVVASSIRCTAKSSATPALQKYRQTYRQTSKPNAKAHRRYHLVTKLSIPNMPSSKYGSGSGGGNDPFKNSTSGSMSKKLKEPKKKRGDSKNKEEEQTSVSRLLAPSRSISHPLMLTTTPKRRRTQNRTSQRAYRERREHRLQELEAQVQEAETLNQTLTAAYQELRAEMDSLQAEKAQEQYYASMAAAQQQQQQQQAGGPSSGYDPSAYGAAEGGYGDPNMWAYDSTNWVPEEWDQGGSSGGGHQQY